MKTETLTTPLTIIGHELRTRNEIAGETIPPFWGEFSAFGGLGQFPERLSDDVYAVYTNFEHEGVDNAGTYSLVIGALVAADTPSTGDLVRVTIPASNRAVFPVESGRPDLVGAKWQEIWSRSDLAKTFIAEYERYAPDGAIDISIGVAAES